MHSWELMKYGIKSVIKIRDYIQHIPFTICDYYATTASLSRLLLEKLSHLPHNTIKHQPLAVSNTDTATAR